MIDYLIAVTGFLLYLVTDHIFEVNRGSLKVFDAVCCVIGLAAFLMAGTTDMDGLVYCFVLIAFTSLVKLVVPDETDD